MNRNRMLLLLAAALAGIAAAAALLARIPPQADESNPAGTAIASAHDDLGRILYRHYCSDCHGDTGQGDGRNAFMFDAPPPDFTTSSLARAGGDPLAHFIVNGSAASGRSPLCPPWGRTLPSEYLPDLVQHVTTLASTPAERP